MSDNNEVEVVNFLPARLGEPDTHACRTENTQEAPGRPRPRRGA